MEESILNSVKKMLGIDPSYNDFDEDLKVCISSAVHTLYQVGLDGAENFFVTSSEDTWNDLVGHDHSGIVSLVKTYVYTKVRMLFDPPTSSFVLTSLENQNKELEWRIYIELEGGFNEQSDRLHKRLDSDCGYIQPGGRHSSSEHDKFCGERNPWEGVPRNRDKRGPGYLGSLRRLRDEMGSSERSSEV